MEFAPRPLKRFLSPSDDDCVEIALKKLARDADLEQKSSDDESVNSYEDCPTVILGEDSSSDLSSDDSDTELRHGRREFQTNGGVNCFVFENSDGPSDDEVEESFFADESSDTDDMGEVGGSSGGLFFVVPRKRNCYRCGKTTENSWSCPECWIARKAKTGAPPKLKKKVKKQYESAPLSPGDACAVCYTEPKTLTLVHGDTGHKCVCYDCAGKLLSMKIQKRRCPICREIFTSVKLNRKMKDFKKALRAE